MIINKPYVEQRGDETFLISKIKDEKTAETKEIFYSVPNQYAEYLCHEVADAFVVAMLLPALFSGQDIKICAPISELLYYQIENNLTYTLSKVFSLKQIKIYPESTLTLDFNPNGVATGFSGGIDSFTTVLQHLNDVSSELKLTHITLFNIGSYGNDFQKAEQHFASDAERACEIAEHINMPLVTLESNFNYFYSNKNEIIYNFSSRSTMCIISGVLALQKLFKYYFIASSDIIDDIHLNKHDQYYYEWLIASFLSSKNCTIIIANADMNRVDKTKHIVDNPLVQEGLYVCAADIYNDTYSTHFSKFTSPNCSECIKCQRTLITLDLLGKLELYKNRFDLGKYYNYKDKLIYSILAGYKRDHFLREIYDLMKEVKYNIPLKYKISVIGLKTKRLFSKNKIIRTVYRAVFK